jgi:hypothetical protein
VNGEWQMVNGLEQFSKQCLTHDSLFAIYYLRLCRE